MTQAGDIQRAFDTLLREQDVLELRYAIAARVAAHHFDIDLDGRSPGANDIATLCARIVHIHADRIELELTLTIDDLEMPIDRIGPLRRQLHEHEHALHVEVIDDRRHTGAASSDDGERIISVTYMDRFDQPAYVRCTLPKLLGLRGGTYELPVLAMTRDRATTIDAA